MKEFKIPTICLYPGNEWYILSQLRNNGFNLDKPIIIIHDDYNNECPYTTYRQEEKVEIDSI